MRHHLEAKHLAKYEQPKAKEKELAQEKERSKCSSLGGSGSNQPTLVESFVKSQPLAFYHPRAKEISKRTPTGWAGPL